MRVKRQIFKRYEEVYLTDLHKNVITNASEEVDLVDLHKYVIINIKNNN